MYQNFTLSSTARVSVEFNYKTTGRGGLLCSRWRTVRFYGIRRYLWPTKWLLRSLNYSTFSVLVFNTYSCL